MSNIKELAKRVYEDRKDAETRKVEDYVRKILEVFNASNSSVGTLLVWQIRLDKEDDWGQESDDESLNIRVSFDKSVNGKFYDWDIFDEDEKDVPILHSMLQDLEIPRELFEELFEYCNKNLSDYLETTNVDDFAINIKLKNEPICERREPR